MYQSLHENCFKKRLTDRQIVHFWQKSARLGLERAKRMQDRYTDTQLDWPDANAASKLAGSVVIYKAKDGSGVTDWWLSREIAPAITSSFNEGIGAILGRALLWACHEPSISELVSPEIRHNVVAKYIMLKVDISLDKPPNINDNENPIERIEVLVSEMNGSVCMDELRDNEEPREAGDRAPRRSVEQWRNAMYAKLSTTFWMSKTILYQSLLMLNNGLGE